MKTTQRKTRTVRAPMASATPCARFEYVNGNAKSVYLAGTFNDRHPGASEMVNVGDGRWIKELALPPGTYEYRFVVDGVWLADPSCPEFNPNPFNGCNSVLRVQTNGEVKKVEPEKNYEN